MQATCRICHQLASGGSQLSSTVDSIYKVALNILFKDQQVLLHLSCTQLLQHWRFLFSYAFMFLVEVFMYYHEVFYLNSLFPNLVKP